MAAKDKLVTVEGLAEAYNSLRVPSIEIQITTGQWNGNNPYTFTANVSNVTTSTFINAQLDSSVNNLRSALNITTGAGIITFSTAILPVGTINVTVYFPGIQGDVETQVLSDVYSKSQTDALVAQSASRIEYFSTDSGIVIRLDATDLNTIKRTGNYYANNNCPNSISGGGYLVVIEYSATYVKQIMYPYNNEQTYTRSLNNGTWSGWIEQSMTNIGTVYTGSGSVSSISNATHTDVLSATLPAGTYVIVRGCDFNSNSTGVRRVAKDNSSARNAYVIANAVSGFDTVIQYTEIITLSVQTEIKCNVYQNSGAAMNIWPYMYAVRIK